MAFIPVTSYSQVLYTLKGQACDENRVPIQGANVFLSPIQKITVTDQNGNFEFRGLTDGKYTIEISFLGFEKYSETFDISNKQNLSLQLKPLLQTLNEVIITGNQDEKRKKEESLNIEIVNSDYLKQNLGGSLMQSLERLPGVTTIDIGSGQSKPVIRGMGFNRVVVVENGIKHEAQQWGDDHGLEIDQYAVDYVEVIKGPASLMYGSDAIGGVIDMKNRQIPAENSLGGSVDFSGKTNNDYLGTSLAIYGRKNWFFADLRATIIDFADYKVPTDSVDIYSYKAALHKKRLRNTAGNEKNLHLSLGVIRTKFQSRFYISNVNAKSGFFANAHGLEPRRVDANLHDNSNRDIQFPNQEVEHFKLINKSQYNWERLKIETELGFQHNFRQEWSQYVNHGWMPAVFPDTLDFNADLERQFDKEVYSQNAKINYAINNKVVLTTGINSELQVNRINGRGFIVPAYKQYAIGSYAFVKYHFSDRSNFLTGMRYDYGQINTQEYYDWFPSPVNIQGDTTLNKLKRATGINRNFSSISWSAGYNYNSEKWTFKANLGKSFRMPTAKELAANGVNYHHFSYEVGSADLLPETSYQFDIGMEYKTNKIAVGLSPFLNYFTNYIYLNPSSEHDRYYGFGNQVYNYMQSRVFRYGSEIHAHYQVLKPVQLGIMGEYVYSEQLSGAKKGFTLPFSPPASAIFNIKYQILKIKRIENAYLSVDYRLTAPQKNIVPPEETTDGNQVVNIGLGGDIKLKNQSISITLQVQNLLNNKYFNHTSYYRLINVPEPGRNFILNVSVPFSVNNK